MSKASELLSKINENIDYTGSDKTFDDFRRPADLIHKAHEMIQSQDHYDKVLSTVRRRHGPEVAHLFDSLGAARDAHSIQDKMHYHQKLPSHYNDVADAADSIHGIAMVTHP